MEDDIDEVLNINQSIESISKSKNKKKLLVKKKEENEEKENELEIKEEKDKSNEDIKQEVKDYISHAGNDPEYLKLIETDPQSLFESIDENKLLEWMKILKAKSPLTPQLKNKDKEILDIQLDDIKKKYPIIYNDS